MTIAMASYNNSNIPPRNTDTPASGTTVSPSPPPPPTQPIKSSSLPHAENIDIINAIDDNAATTAPTGIGFVDDGTAGTHDQQPPQLLGENSRQMTLELEQLWEQSYNLMAYLKEDRKMSLWDVVTLNLNSMIGTGIFTTPGLVLALTRSKALTLMFWVAGGVYAILGVYVYGRYSKYMFVNGGEFLWLDAVFKKPKYLFAITTAGFFFVLDTTAGNCLAFSKHVALMRDPGATRTEQLERDVVAYIAICVLTVVCFIHFFSPRVGLFLNKYFAWFKVGFLVSIIIAGFIASQQSESGTKEGWGWHENEKPLVIDVLSALIFIIYSYTGWQTAFYVAGEVGEDDKPNQEDLQRGTIISVLITTLLYVLTTAAYCVAIPFHKLVGDSIVGNDLAIVVNFIPKAFNNDNTLWAKLFVAFSALGFLISTIYSYSRLNQKIFRQGFFPFYQLCDRDHPYYKTPIGGLIVHWFFSTLTIAITPNTPGGYGFMINVKSYGHITLTFFLGIGVFFLHTARPASNKTKNRVLASGAILAILSLFLLIVSALGHGYPAYWLWPVSLAVVVGFFVIYWALFALWIGYCARDTGDRNGKNTIRVYEYYPQLQRVQREMVPDSKRASKLVSESPSWPRASWTQPPQAGANDQVYHRGSISGGAGTYNAGVGGGYGGKPLADLQEEEVINGTEESQPADVNGVAPSKENDIDYRTMQKLAYRWNMWGETRLIVYNWTPFIEKKLEQLYTFCGMPHQHHKPIPQSPWLRVGFQAGTFNSTANGGDQGPYYMVRQRNMGSGGSPYGSLGRGHGWGSASASGTPPPVGNAVPPSPSSRSSPMLLGKNPGQQPQGLGGGEGGASSGVGSGRGSAGRNSVQNYGVGGRSSIPRQGANSHARRGLPVFNPPPQNESPKSSPRAPPV